MSLEKFIRMNQLFAFYQGLLTQKQQDMLHLYYEEDYSLAEIAEQYEISRQAVHDTIKRTEKALEEYEVKLHLYERLEERKKLYNQLEILVSDTQAILLVNQLKELDQ